MTEYELFPFNAEEQTVRLTLCGTSHYAGTTATSVIDLKRGLGMRSLTLRYLGIEKYCRKRPILALIRRIARSIIPIYRTFQNPCAPCIAMATHVITPRAPLARILTPEKRMDR
jgi:hypothetical protein